MKTFRKMMKDKVYKFSGHDYGTFAYIPNDSILELTGAADIKVTTDVGYNVLITLSGQSKLTIHGNVVKAQFVLNGFSQLHFSNEQPQRVLNNICASDRAKVYVAGSIVSEEKNQSLINKK